MAFLPSLPPSRPPLSQNSRLQSTQYFFIHQHCFCFYSQRLCEEFSLDADEEDYFNIDDDSDDEEGSQEGS